ncbi:uncharacterized protein TNCV_1338961 [Trichonephila clavipes]|nr:uncharacterized protein TNCV_1338961 [Trichonephila clavipes]
MSNSNGYHHILKLEVLRSLAKESSERERATSTSLTYQKLYYNTRSKLNLIGRMPPTHQLHTGTSPGCLLEIKCNHGYQTALARLTSDHLKCLSFESGRKIHPTYKNCCDHPASPDPILRCIGLSKGGLSSDPLIVIDFFVVNNLLELILTYVRLFEDKKQHQQHIA